MKQINEVRIALQKAFLCNISSEMRGISFDFKEANGEFSIQVFFYQKQSEESEELVSCALTELEAMCSFIGSIKEEFIISQVPFSEISNLKNVIFWRNEVL